jgi:ElaB/YqjD/DUF883 family membrane-anchored ribosome-binding protein
MTDMSWDRGEGDVPVEPLAGTAGDSEVDALVEDIEETRSQMTGTVDQIGDRLDPANIVDDAKQTVRDATVGKVETMTDQATQAMGEARQTAQQAGGSLVETIRRNPLPAALVGVGVAWLWMHRAPAQMGWSSSAGYRPTGSYAGEPYGGRGYTSGEAGWSSGGTRSSMAGRMGDVAGDLGDRASDAADQVRDTADDLRWKAQDVAGRTTSQAQTSISGAVESTSRLIGQNPLAAGAVAVAVGAAIGMALPPTRQEREVLGPTSQQLLDKAEGTATRSLHEMSQGQQQSLQQGQQQGQQQSGQQQGTQQQG